MATTRDDTSESLTAAIKDQAAQLGFQRVGVCPAVTPQGIHRFQEWLDRGYAGDMHYLSNRAAAYHHPRFVLDGVRSLIMLAINYRTAEPRERREGEARISRYAWGTTDYHDVIHQRLKTLKAFVATRRPAALVRGVVDTAPLLEREFARLAGLGWVGKHTLLLNQSQGSWFFLAALLTDLELIYDAPTETEHCGTCTACLDACPTNAFPEPYVLDARRCISYLTIELRDSVSDYLRTGLGDWLFGCDICQDVCPWNTRAPVSDESPFWPQPTSDPVDVGELLRLDEAGFRDRFRWTPLWRAKRRGILRNAALVMGNQRPAGGESALAGALQDDEGLVRSAAAWALGQYDTEPARRALQARRTVERDSNVLVEIDAALAHE